MHIWKYSGEVLMFGKVIARNWHGETSAETKDKAKSNLLYKFKKENNLQPWVKVTFVNDISLIR